MGERVNDTARRVAIAAVDHLVTHRNPTVAQYVDTVLAATRAHVAAEAMRDAVGVIEHDLRASWDCCSTCRGRIEALDRLRDYANRLDQQDHEHDWVEYSTFREPHTHFICKGCKAERTERRSRDGGQA